MCSVNAAPTLYIVKIQCVTLHRENIAGVVPILVAVPAYFLNNHILGSREPRFSI